MHRTLTGLLTVAVLCLSACGTQAQDPPADGKVSITVTGQPPTSQAVERKLFDQEVAEFEAANPAIDIVPHEGFMDPKTFSAKLAGGQLEDVYYVYFTDPATIIARRQAADITDAAKDLPVLRQLQQPLIDIFKDRDGRLYGLPTANYSMGLLYNRTLFARAGLNPDKAPATWDEVRDAAKKIAALGNGTVGFAETSKNNQGGWHLVTWSYAMGSRIARQDGGKWVADFNNGKVKQALQQLKDMRWTDGSMGEKQLLEATDLQRMMGAGQLGMYLAAPDNVPVLVKEFKGGYEDYGVAAMPGGQGTLLGGEGYMINPKASAEKIKAGLTWIQWKYLNPDRIETQIKRYLAEKQPIGLPAIPTADIWTGDVRVRQTELKTKYANVPQGNFQSYLDGNTKLRGNLEPPNAQQIWFPAAANAFNIYLLKRFFDQIPGELLEAAVLDGAGQLRILWRIVLPISRPILAVISILAIVAAWRDFIWPLLVFPDPARQTLSVALQRMEIDMPLNLLLAALVLASAPMVALLLFFQRHILAGLTAGSLKG